jgi:glycosidase
MTSIPLHEPWYKNAIIYAVDISRFMDSDGDGSGDFQGLTQQLDYISELGVTCIWLLPFYPSPFKDNGYDIQNYYGIDPRLGTFDDFLTFLKKAGERSLRVMLDMVFNHTSDTHPWFIAARHDVSSHFRDYYSWTKHPPPVPAGKGNIFPGEEKSVWTVIDEYDDRVLIGEIYLPIDELVTYYGDANSEAHLPFNFLLINAPWDAEHIRRVIDKYEASLPPGAWPNWVLGNHDQSRIASRIGDAQARIAAMLLLTLRGTPTMYYGDEIGMHDVVIPQDKIVDPRERQCPGLGLGRDPQRTPMQWSGESNAGFTKGEPWLPIVSDFHNCNVENLRNDPHSILWLYKRLIGVRQSEPALAVGQYAPLDIAPPLFGYLRQDSRDAFAIILNFANEPQMYHSRRTAERGSIVLSTLDPEVLKWRMEVRYV